MVLTFLCFPVTLVNAQGTTDNTNITVNATSFEGLEPIEIARMKFEAFNDGFQGDKLAQNFSNCNDNSLVLTYLEWPTFRAKLYYSDGQEYLQNTTMFLKNSTYPLNECTDAAEQIYYYAMEQQELYGASTGYARAVMLNLFANAIRVQQITNKLQKLTGNSTEDTLAKLYYTGLLINILTVFEPPSDAGDLDLDLNEEDFFSLSKKN